MTVLRSCLLQCLLTCSVNQKQKQYIDLDPTINEGFWFPLKSDGGVKVWPFSSTFLPFRQVIEGLGVLLCKDSKIQEAAAGSEPLIA